MVIQLYTELPGSRFGHAGPLVVSIFGGATTLESLDALDALQEKMLVEHPRLASFSVIVGAPLTGMPKGISEKSSQLRKKYDAKLAGSAIVVLTRGLAGAITRSFLAGFSLASWGEAPMKTFRTLFEAEAWLRSLPGMMPAVRDMNGLAAAVERFMDGLAIET